MRRPADTEPPPLTLIVRPTRQNGRLAAPAEPEHAPTLHAREPLARGFADAQQLGLGLVVVTDAVEPALDQGLLLGRVGGQPAELRVRALEQVRQDHDGIVPEELGEPVGALQGLRGEAEGVVEEDEAAFRGSATRGGGFGNI